MKSYVLAVKTYSWLLPVVEESLIHLDDGAVREASRLARDLRTPNGRPVSDEEALVALNALCELGVMERVGLRYRLNKKRLADTEQLRLGIQTALRIFSEQMPVRSPDIQLCVSLPPSLSAAAEQVIRETSIDLRSSLIDIIANAKQTLILASPFWDADTTAEIIALIHKKLNIGVQVSMLGRFSHELPSGVRAELRRASALTRISPPALHKNSPD
jgi:hypothetical protein